jgi:Protein of unknown function (DUF3592)
MKEPAHFTKMAESWEPPPELCVAMPRQMKFTTAGKINQVLLYVTIVFGLAVVLGVFGAAYGDHRLKRDGVEVDGTVTRTWTQSGRSTSYELAYDFSAGGRTFRGESQIPRRKWQALSAGSHTQVRYVPSDPSINRAAIGFERLIPFWVPAIAFAFWLFFLSLCIFPMRKAKHLLRYGKPAPGMIINNSSGRRPKYGYVIKYEVQLPDGPTVKGATQRDRPYYSGETVCVLYDPKRPRRNDIYPLKMVQIRA